MAAPLVDDYAHLPAEIEAIVVGGAAVATGGDGSWRCSSRTASIEWQSCRRRTATRSSTPSVVITDIYASGTTPIPGVTGKLVVNAVLDAHPTTRLAWMPRRADLIEYVARELREGDVCISMGCGDIATLPDEVQHRRAELRVSAS